MTMGRIENPAVQGGVRRRLAERLDTPEFTQTVSTAQDLAGPRFEHMVECLHRLGPRPLAEMIVEIATVTGEAGLVVGLVQEYSALDPEIVRALGGDQFPPMPLGVAR